MAVLLLEGPDGRLGLRASDGPPGGAGPLAAADLGADDPAAGADAMLAFVDAHLATARLSAPLQRGGSTIGLLASRRRPVRGFDVDEVETLSSLANQATIALEHERLEARLRELAVVDERERIARELHDGIAQVLGYVNTKSQAVDGYLEAGRVEEARVQLAELGPAARAVYVDVRESIVGLRGPDRAGAGPRRRDRRPCPARRRAVTARAGALDRPRRRVAAARPGRGGEPLPDRPGGAHQRAQARLGAAGAPRRAG